MTMGIYCKICGLVGDENIHLHHIIPKSLGGKDLNEDGSSNRIYLCKECHEKIHNIMPKLIWSFIPEEKRESAKETIRKYTAWKYCMEN